MCLHVRILEMLQPLQDHSNVDMKRNEWIFLPFWTASSILYFSGDCACKLTCLLDAP